jgi:hypothetical protein
VLWIAAVWAGPWLSAVVRSAAACCYSWHVSCCRRRGAGRGSGHAIAGTRCSDYCAPDPQLQADEGRIGLLFQARQGQTDEGWGKIGAYYRELSRAGEVSPIVALGQASTGATMIFERPGRAFVAWTESDGEAQ